MADQNSSQGRRPHFHRGRRGQDRRGVERRTTPQESHGGRDHHADVDQLVREIRARISQRHGIELSPAQIQELAARRLDAILEPRHVQPALLEQLRRAAGEPVELPAPAADSGYALDEQALYASPNGLVRALRKLLRPILRLLMNPDPLVDALRTQARMNHDAATRDAARDRTQAEWNALHYEILQRLVTEVARVSIEMQSLSMRVEALGAKVDFNERRVRGLEQASFQVRPQAQRPSPEPSSHQAATPGTPGADGTGEASSESSRRRRRRRRGRRGGAPEGAPAGTDVGAPIQEPDEFDEGEELEAGDDGAPAADAEPAPAAPPQPETPSSAPEPQAAAPEPTLPTQPAPPRDEPVPPAPVDHADPGPTDR
ncbi:MAG TPA: hypothetical protein VG871_20895 [Vicinamibacterales bacterium]|nr:hypothetical protein [Vicinamibacterales bacterium]